MALHSSVRSLRESKIPEYTRGTCLENENEHRLHDIVIKREYVNATNGTLTNFFITSEKHSVQAMRRIILVCGLFAKELKLVGTPVCHVSLAGLVREAAYEGVERRSTNPVMEHIGRGFIVIPDFNEYDDAREVYSARALHNVADYLVTHVSDGGGLVLGGKRFDDDNDVFGSSLSTLLDRRFIYHNVQQG